MPQLRNINLCRNQYAYTSSLAAICFAFLISYYNEIWMISMNAFISVNGKWDYGSFADFRYCLLPFLSSENILHSWDKVVLANSHYRSTGIVGIHYLHIYLHGTKQTWLVCIDLSTVLLNLLWNSTKQTQSTNEKASQSR